MRRRTLLSSKSSIIVFCLMLVFPALILPLAGFAEPTQGIPNTVNPWKTRTLEDMRAFDAARAPMSAPLAIPFRPTMDMSDYLTAKAAAGTAPKIPKQVHGAAMAAPPTADAVHCGGIGQGDAGGGFPPDTHGAVGLNHYVHVVNFAVRIYSKSLSGSCPTVLLTVSLNAFFGYGGATLFDPRVVYDMAFDRWIVTAAGFPEGGPGSVQFHFVAVSQTGDPAGAYFIYPFEMRVLLGALGSTNDSMWDFPQLGYDEESVIITGNVFDPGYTRSAVFFLPKARMYHGLGFSYCIFDFGAEGTVAPPLVLDQSPITALATSRVSANRIRLTKYTGTSRVCPRLVEQVDLTPAATLSIPPHAPQPGTTKVIDTSDARFVNASTQLGMPAFGDSIRLWQTATLGTGFAIPRFYQINANEGGSFIESECDYYASDSSYDFNASIAANLDATVFITYSSTDPANDIGPQVRFTGKKANDLCAALGAPGGIASRTSPAPLTGNFDPNFQAQRWGDYSAVTIDPADPTKAWGVNEFAKKSPKWKSWLFNMSNP